MQKTNVIELTGASNIFEARVRLTKALKLAAALREHGASSKDLDGLPVAAWTMAEKIAGTRVSSSTTRATVARVMQAQEDLAAIG